MKDNKKLNSEQKPEWSVATEGQPELQKPETINGKP
jgi:hypothetical protein